MHSKSLVTGATGHLGYNLCQLLIEEQEDIIATYRSEGKSFILDKLDCQKARVDIMDKSTMRTAFKGVDKLYAVGASFQMWSKNPKEDIYDNNVTGTQNLFDIAAECGIKDIVYISSVAALDFTQLPAKEENGYNTDRRSWYYNSKNDSDKLALRLGREYGIRTVVILPSAMIGADVHYLSYSNKLVAQILRGEIIIDTNITLNWIDVQDVAKATYQAMAKGRNQERYIIANKKHTSLTSSVAVAKELFPALKLKKPLKIPKFFLYVVAILLEWGSKLSGKEPLLQKHYLDMFYGLKQDYDITKAQQELEFNPIGSKKALERAMLYLQNDWKNPS